MVDITFRAPLGRIARDQPGHRRLQIVFDAVIGLALFIAVLALLDVLALRFGADSRTGEPGGILG